MHIVTLMTRAKVFLATIIIVPVALVLGYGILVSTNPVSTNGHGKQKVVVVVAFMPQRLDMDDEVPVNVDIYVNNVKTNAGFDKIRVSPWNITIEVPKGQTLRLEAQKGGLNWLECRIVVNGKVESYDHVNGGGRVKCLHLVTL